MVSLTVLCARGEGREYIKSGVARAARSRVPAYRVNTQGYIIYTVSRRPFAGFRPRSFTGDSPEFNLDTDKTVR